MSGEDFWSRRRAAVAAEEAEMEVETSAEEAADAAAAYDEMPDEEVLAALNLPDPDRVTSGEALREFLAEAVPDRLRRRALRALWRSNPVLANVDHLVEYGEDYTDAATVVENLQSAVQIGRRFVQKLTEEDAVEETIPELAEAEEAPHLEPVFEPAEEAPPLEDRVEVAAPSDPDQSPAFETKVVAATPRRRMRFEFSD